MGCLVTFEVMSKWKHEEMFFLKFIIFLVIKEIHKNEINLIGSSDVLYFFSWTSHLQVEHLINIKWYQITKTRSFL